MNKINLPENAREIIEWLHGCGFNAYVVGGCVRDSIMQKTPHDYDICTSATPYDVMRLFKEVEVLPTGLQHGTVTIVVDNEHYEVTTFRQDGEYTDNRRPDTVKYTQYIEEDLQRRDFTINAIAYNDYIGYVDLFNGIEDIKNGVIRCVGDPYERFNEDGLRVLRAIRFAAQLGFKIEKNTSKAIHDCKHLLDNISKERIQSELVKILNSRYGGSFVLREYTDVVCQIIPEIKDMVGFEQNHPYQEYDVWEHTLRCLEFFWENDNNSCSNDIITRLAVLFHDIGKPHCYNDCYVVEPYGINRFPNHEQVSAKMTYKILRDLKFSNEIVAYTTQLVSYHMSNLEEIYSIGSSKSTIKKMLNKIGADQLKRFILMRKCNFITGTKLYMNQDRLISGLYHMESILNEIIENDECYNIKGLNINGDDLIEIGFEQGKQLGNVLNMLLDLVTNGEVENNKDELLLMAKAIKNNLVL